MLANVSRAQSFKHERSRSLASAYFSWTHLWFGLHSFPRNPTYNLTNFFSAIEMFGNHKSGLASFGIDQKKWEARSDYNFLGFRRCTKIHINIDSLRLHWSVRQSLLSILLTKLLTHLKQGLQKYYETAYSRRGISKIWLLKNSKEVLDNLRSPNFNLNTNIKSFDFATLYTTIPHQKLKSRLENIIRNSFHKNGNWRYKYLVLGWRGTLFCEGTLRFEKQVHWRRHHQDAQVSIWQHFRCLRRKEFPSDNRHCHGHKLCPLKPTYFCTHTKRNSYSPCSRPVTLNFSSVYQRNLWWE